MRVGIDIVRIRRFAKIKKGDYKFWKTVFSENEWRYCFKDANFADHLAGVFALKEAALKAMGVSSIAQIRKLKVGHLKGSPSVNLPKSAASVSHDGEYAVACVILS